MKRENKTIRSAGTGLPLLLTLAAAFVFTVFAGAQTTKKAVSESEAESARQAQVGANYDMPFVQVEQMPLYPGGDEALLKYIAENTRYPESAKKNNITGKVIVKFIVGKDCSISDITILQSVNPEIDAEAVRVIKSLPKFAEPGKEKGIPVAVFYMVPITFALK